MRTADCIFLLFAYGVANVTEEQVTDGKHIHSSVFNHTLNSSW